MNSVLPPKKEVGRCGSSLNYRGLGPKVLVFEETEVN